MDRFTTCIRQSPAVLMEGALGERLKREYGISFDAHIAMSGLAGCHGDAYTGGEAAGMALAAEIARRIVKQIPKT